MTPTFLISQHDTKNLETVGRKTVNIYKVGYRGEDLPEGAVAAYATALSAAPQPPALAVPSQEAVTMDDEDRTPIPDGYDEKIWRAADEVHHAMALVADDTKCVKIIYDALAAAHPAPEAVPVEVKNEPVAWTTHTIMQRLSLEPKVAGSIWGLPNGKINVPLYALSAIPTDVERLTQELRREFSHLTADQSLTGPYILKRINEALARATQNGKEG